MKSQDAYEAFQTGYDVAKTQTKPTLIEICAQLDRLCRELGIEPPAMALTFKSQWDRAKFEHSALESLRGLSPFNHGGLTSGIKEVHGIPLQLLAEHPEHPR